MTPSHWTPSHRASKNSAHKNLASKNSTRKNWATGLLLSLVFTFGLAGCSRAVRGGRLMTFSQGISGNASLNSKHNDLDPQISGRYMTYVSDRRGRQEIFLFDMRDRRLIPLPGLSRFDNIVSHPSVSENGNWIVFAANQDGRTGIYLYRRNLRQVRNLVPTLKGEVRNPSISARGDRIAFEVSTQGQWDIAIYNRRGRPLAVPGNPR